jgi:CheY-like chemotaxis protein
MSGSNRRALVVDDAVGARLTMAALLEDAGFQVVEAETLAEGRARAAEGKYALAVIDLQLPDGLGTLLVSEFRRQQPAAIVAMLSGNPLPPIHGVDLTLTKGDAPEQMIRRIDQAVAGAGTGGR